MKIYAGIIALFVGAAICGGASRSVAAQPVKPPGPGGLTDDLTSDGGGFAPVTWRPVIWSFYVKTTNSGGVSFEGKMKADPARESTPTDIGIWEWIEPQIRVRRQAADQRAATEAQQVQLKKDIEAMRQRLDAEKDNARHHQLEAEMQLLQERLTSLDLQIQSGKFQGFGAAERVVSGWQRDRNATGGANDVNFSGDGFNGPVTAEEAGDRKDLIGKPHPIDQFSMQAPIYLFFEPDILMTADQDFKDRTLHKHFSVVKLLVTGHPVPKVPGDPDDPSSPARVRNFPVELNPDRPPPVRILRRIQMDPSNGKVLPWDESSFSGGNPIAVEFKLPEAGVTVAEPSVWEFRIAATIRGRLNDDEPFETKEVEGAIRVAFKDNAFSVDKIGHEVRRK